MTRWPAHTPPGEPAAAVDRRDGATGTPKRVDRSETIDANEGRS
ncbi:MAG: hypothetical protein M0Z82_07965 [Actinomycetota bacterium]|nr:hypothetical protein [Actinomycetota bacterium]